MKNRTSFFEDRSKLYFFKGKQQIAITEKKHETLFLFLEIKWEQIEHTHKELNKTKKDEKTPITISLEYNQFKKIASNLTRKLILPIGTDKDNIKLIIIEKDALESIIQKHQAKKISVKEASVIAKNSTGTIRNWIKKGHIGAEIINNRIMVNSIDLSNYLLKKL